MGGTKAQTRVLKEQLFEVLSSSNPDRVAILKNILLGDNPLPPKIASVKYNPHWGALAEVEINLQGTKVWTDLGPVPSRYEIERLEDYRIIF